MTTMLPDYTSHAYDRSILFFPLVTLAEIEKSLYTVSNFKAGGQTYVKVKALGEIHIIVDKNGSEHKGDTVFAVVQRDTENEPGRVTTVLIRNASQPSRYFRRNDEIPQHQLK